MEDFLYYNELYDLYGNLLTDKQRLYFEDYYFNNLSLGEMALNYNVSRNAIFKQIKISILKLTEYEEKLGFLRKINRLNEIVNKSKDEKLQKDILDLF